MLPGRPEDRSPDDTALREDPEDLSPGTAAERTRLCSPITGWGLALLAEQPGEVRAVVEENAAPGALG